MEDHSKRSSSRLESIPGSDIRPPEDVQYLPLLLIGHLPQECLGQRSLPPSMHQFHHEGGFIVYCNTSVPLILQAQDIIVGNGQLLGSPVAVTAVGNNGEHSPGVVEGHEGALGEAAADAEEGEGAHEQPH